MVLLRDAVLDSNRFRSGSSQIRGSDCKTCGLERQTNQLGRPVAARCDNPPGYLEAHGWLKLLVRIRDGCETGQNSKAFLRSERVDLLDHAHPAYRSPHPAAEVIYGQNDGGSFLEKVQRPTRQCAYLHTIVFRVIRACNLRIRRLSRRRRRKSLHCSFCRAGFPACRTGIRFAPTSERSVWQSIVTARRIPSCTTSGSGGAILPRLNIPKIFLTV